jgi:hypothetical protein
MSVSQLDPGEGSGSELPDYDPGEDVQAALYVDDTQIPIINDGVTLHERKDGPAAINRAADVSFPAEGTDTSWIDVVRYEQTTSLGSDLTRADLRLEVNTVGDETEVLAPSLKGFIMGVGPGGSTDNSMRMRIGGPALLLDKIPASASYTRSTRLREILNDITSFIESEQPVYDEISVRTRVEGTSQQIANANAADVRWLTARRPIGLANYDRTLSDTGPTRFVPRKDSVADMLSWVEDTFGVRCWFEFSDDTIELLAADSPTPLPRFASHLDGEVPIYEANPLAEISPINGLRVQGATKHLIKGDNLGAGIKTPFTASDYPVAVAYVPELVQKAGGLLLGRDSAPKVGNESELAAVAQSRLKERLSTAGSGGIVTPLAPSLRPFTMISTKPVVNNEIARPTAQTFEIEQVTHRAQADDRGVTYWSELSVSVATPLEDIKVRTRTIPIESPDRATFAERRQVVSEELDEIGDDINTIVGGIEDAIDDLLGNDG